MSVSRDRLILQNVAAENIRRALQLHIGRGRRYSVSDIAAGTGLSERTVSSWISDSEPKNPTFRDIQIIAHFLGEQDGQIMLGNALLGTPFRAHPVSRRTASAIEVVSTLVKGTAAFVDAGIDHVFNHVEKGRLKPWADQMISILLPFSSYGEAEDD